MSSLQALRAATKKAILTSFFLTAILAGGSSQATTLTGDFALNNWTLKRFINSSLNGQYGYGTIPGGDYSCDSGASGSGASVGSLACVLGADATTDPANFGVVGSTLGDIGTADQAVDVYWTLPYNGPSGTLSFDFLFSSDDTSASDFGFFKINGTDIINTSSPGSTPESQKINTGDILYFGVYTTDNKGAAADVQISNFNFTPEVPGPLPILGAGAAFGWSRRLRSRIRGGAC